ncbi:MAG: hypothetical protein FAF03_11710 [Epsilonproteobacteria bacterium]|nr:hypothetical protein [Campylobacterota bacterium]MBA1421466.1 hypothetical protein [Campylobacterota bacterium]
MYEKLYNKEGNVPPPFRIDAKLYSKTYDFGIFIFDVTIPLRPLLSALKYMLQAKTTTDDNLSFPRSEIYLNGNRLVYDERNHLKVFKVLPRKITIDKHIKDIAIEIVTPLYIKDKGNFKRSIKLDDILLSIHRRKRTFEIGKQDTSSLKYTPSYTLISSELKIFHEKTHSNDQNTDVPLLGVTGQLVIMNLDEKSFELLKYGEILALGNKVAKGQGIIRLVY